MDHGRGELRARVTGNAASPTISVDPTSVGGSVSREQIEGGLQELLQALSPLAPRLSESR